ncbi:MAG: VOC family protein [Phycisphaerales bacterium]
MSRVIHFEIHATHPQALVDFYGALFGWSFTKWGAIDYWLIGTGPAEEPGINGGLVLRRGPAGAGGEPVTSFVCTVQVASAEATVAKAQGLGGTVAHPTMPISGVGWLAYLKDPDGNIFGVMQPDPKAP